MQVLLAAGDVVDRKNDRHGSTPLFVAAQQGHDHVVNTLVRGGALMNRPLFASGCTALHIASQRGRVKVVGVLVSAGAEVDVRTTDDGAWTPLLMAAQHNQASVVDTLARAGADVNAATKDIGWTALLYVLPGLCVCVCVCVCVFVRATMFVEFCLIQIMCIMTYSSTFPSRPLPPEQNTPVSHAVLM